MHDDMMRGDRSQITIVHTSDLHIDDEPRHNGYTGLIGLAAVLSAAADVRADLVLLAGDTFDNGRVAPELARRAADLIAAQARPVVILPGNHDPALDQSMFHKSGLVDVPQARVIGVNAPETLLLEAQGLEIRGRPHRSYDDMHPLPDSLPRLLPWLVVVGHGHYVPAEDWADEAHRSWRISDAALDATGADYVALGHWDRCVTVGAGQVKAHYSGSPDLARTANVVRLDREAGVGVARRELSLGLAPRWG
jgi:DNA repair exonuclease SbcCD nuclease subunit